MHRKSGGDEIRRKGDEAFLNRAAPPLFLVQRPNQAGLWSVLKPQADRHT